MRFEAENQPIDLCAAAGQDDVVLDDDDEEEEEPEEEKAGRDGEFLGRA